MITKNAGFQQGAGVFVFVFGDMWRHYPNKWIRTRHREVG
jgi:hypothetical protein